MTDDQSTGSPRASSAAGPPHQGRHRRRPPAQPWWRRRSCLGRNARPDPAADRSRPDLRLPGGRAVASARVPPASSSRTSRPRISRTCSTSRSPTPSRAAGSACTRRGFVAGHADPQLDAERPDRRQHGLHLHPAGRPGDRHHGGRARKHPVRHRRHRCPRHRGSRHGQSQHGNVGARIALTPAARGLSHLPTRSSAPRSSSSGAPPVHPTPPEQLRAPRRRRPG